EEHLLSDAGSIATVQTIGSAALMRRYALRDYHDPDTHRAGHIPYTAQGYAAIGTAVFRAIVAAKREPYKVIILDCDNTLWNGVCGEDGALGVEISAQHRALQTFMVEQMNAGMLLCV